MQNVVLVERPPVTTTQIGQWEQNNHPYVLPEDYKAFLLSMNGFELSWYLVQRTPVAGSVQKPQGRDAMLTGDLETTLFGRMHVNPLDEVVCVEEEVEPAFKAFDLDKMCKAGKVCLRYKSTTRCEVWHLDFSGSWAFVAASFSDYYRLLVAHLGVPRWQSIFSANGPDPTTSFWVRWLTKRCVEA